MKILKYNGKKHRSEFEKFLKTIDKKEKRIELIDNFKKKNSEEISTKDFLNDTDFSVCFWKLHEKDVNYFTVGEPQNVAEMIAKAYINSELSYIVETENSPEDLVEGRTDYDQLMGYCDEMYDFIESLKEMLKKS